MQYNKGSNSLRIIMGIKILAADKAFADCLKEAHDYTCERCGKQGRMETSHIYSRRHRLIRWAKDNANCLCNYCHRIWHESPVEAFKWLEGLYGERHIELLIEKRNMMIKVLKTEEKEIVKHYREQLKIIKEKRSNGAIGYIDFISYQ